MKEKELNKTPTELFNDLPLRVLNVLYENLEKMKRNTLTKADFRELFGYTLSLSQSASLIHAFKRWRYLSLATTGSGESKQYAITNIDSALHARIITLIKRKSPREAKVSAVKIAETLSMNTMEQLYDSLRSYIGVELKAVDLVEIFNNEIHIKHVASMMYMFKAYGFVEFTKSGLGKRRAFILSQVYPSIKPSNRVKLPDSSYVGITEEETILKLRERVVNSTDEVYDKETLDLYRSTMKNNPEWFAVEDDYQVILAMLKQGA